MRPILFIATLAFGSLAIADEASDRKAIEGIIAALNDAGKSHAELFTKDSGDSQAQIDALLAREIWTERFPEPPRPSIALTSVRFITPEVALVDAVSSQYGSVVLRAPVILVLLKDRDWRIAAVRVAPEMPRFEAVPVPVKLADSAPAR